MHVCTYVRMYVCRMRNSNNDESNDNYNKAMLVVIPLRHELHNFVLRCLIPHRTHYLGNCYTKIFAGLSQLSKYIRKRNKIKDNSDINIQISSQSIKMVSSILTPTSSESLLRRASFERPAPRMVGFPSLLVWTPTPPSPA